MIQGRLTEPLEMLVIGLRRAPTVATEDAARVDVHDETEMVPGVEEHAVGGLGTDPRDA
jgi:hypothetical protein